LGRGPWLDIEKLTVDKCRSRASGQLFDRLDGRTHTCTVGETQRPTAEEVARYGGLTTRIDTNWQIRWWHKFDRADLLAAILVCLGLINTVRGVLDRHFAGLGWLFAVVIGVILFAASGVERSQLNPGPGSGEDGRTWGPASRAFTRITESGRRLDDRLDVRTRKRRD
jgi:hypothetical protein